MLAGSLERRVEPARELDGLVGGQVRLVMGQPVLGRWHAAGPDREPRGAREVELAVPLREVDHVARGLDVALDDPRHRRDVRVPRPPRLVAVAVEARPDGQLAGARRVPSWLLDHARVRVGAAVGDELHQPEQPDQAADGDQQALEKAPHGRVHTPSMSAGGGRGRGKLPQGVRSPSEHHGAVDLRAAAARDVLHRIPCPI